MTTAILLALLPWEVAAHPPVTDAEAVEITKVHCAAIERWATVQCDVTLREGTVNPRTTVVGKYYRSRDFIHVKETFKEGGRLSEHVAKDGLITSIDRIDKQTSAGRCSTREVFCISDAWSLMQLNFPGRGTTRVGLEDLLRIDHRLKQWSHVSEGGQEFIRLEFEFDDPDVQVINLRIDFDPRVNYLVRRLRIRPGPTEDYYVLREVVEFAVPQPGTFFPVRSTSTGRKGGTPVSRMEATLTNLSVNEPLPPDTGTISIPDGTPFTDRINGETYTADQNGNAKDQPIAVNVAPAMVNPRRQSGTMVRPAEVGFRWFWTGIAACAAMSALAWYQLRKSRPRTALPNAKL